ncbi:hypothetical protein C7B82_25850 [Stenomitos frigidus ULC18]|uniref:Uncharacterized protein n=1 Tax=Stenomitos frigidus ULC18 TaxID=2107698 RepID=A0A2T1DWF8_9CYAN|nr:hypothetical protein C7B82_25850 [Stenomitos frigidus ULC18]
MKECFTLTNRSRLTFPIYSIIRERFAASHQNVLAIVQIFSTIDEDFSAIVQIFSTTRENFSASHQRFVALLKRFVVGRVQARKTVEFVSAR